MFVWSSSRHTLLSPVYCFQTLEVVISFRWRWRWCSLPSSSSGEVDTRLRGIRLSCGREFVGGWLTVADSGLTHLCLIHFRSALITLGGCLVAAPTLADKRQTTISPLVSDRAHQQITPAGGWEWEDWVELRTFYLNLNMTAMPFHYIWHQGSRLIANIKSGLVLLFRFIEQRLTAAAQCSGVSSGDCLHDRDTEQTRSRPRARTTIRLVGLPPHAQALMHSGQWRKGLSQISQYGRLLVENTYYSYLRIY